MMILSSGKINIDEQAGMKLAESLGVLDEGLPNIRLFTSSDKGVSILKGIFNHCGRIAAVDSLESIGDSGVHAKHIIAQVKKHTTGMRLEFRFY